MKKRLRLLAWFLTLTMLCELLPLGTFAQSDIGQNFVHTVVQSLEEENSTVLATGKCGDDLTWSLSSDGILTISGTGEMYDYAFIYSYPSSLSAPWTYFISTNSSADLKRVVINSGVTSIGSNAFLRCDQLISISIPDTVVSIGENAFRMCQSLSSLDIPNSTVSIGDSAFYDCRSLVSITLSNSITSIPSSAFYYCISLPSITIPDSVISIDDGAFEKCYNLTSIEFSNSVTSIGNSAFLECSGLKSVSLPSSVIHIGDKAFESCRGLTSIFLPNSITSTGESTFRDCINLTSVSLPDSLTSIPKTIFWNCSSLNSITIPDSITSIDGWAFYGCTALTSVFIPNSVISIGESAFSWCTALTAISIPNSVTSIGKDAFLRCDSLASVSLPNSITSISQGTFTCCYSLTSITIPDSVTSIDGASVSGYGAFSNCTALTSIFIPDSVTSIGEYAFESCSHLADVYYSGTQEQWEAISIRYKNEPLLNATIHYQTTGSDEQKSFTFGRDNLSFTNYRSYFFSYTDILLNELSSKVSLIKKDFQGSSIQKNYCYKISDEKFEQLTAGLAPSVKKSIEEVRFSKWGGSCRGMSSVVMLHYLYPQFFPLSNFSSISATTMYDLPYPKNNSEISDVITYYHLTQLLPTYLLKKLEIITNSMNDFSGTLNDLISSLEDGNPILAGIVGDNGSHAIILLNIINSTEDSYQISIYDPVYTESRTLTLSKYPYISMDQSTLLGIEYGNYKYLQSYIKSTELEQLDIRNYFGLSDNEHFSTYDVPYIAVSPKTDITLNWNEKNYYTLSNNKELQKDSSVITFFDDFEDDIGESIRNIVLQSVPESPIQIEISPHENNNDVSILLNDTLLSLSTSGPVSLTYDEESRTVDVTAETPTDVNILMTQNTTDENWPWNSWAIDTSGTTEFHAELKDDGLHLSGDGIANAKYATENADTDTTDEGTIPTGAKDVTIIKKDDDDKQTVIKDNTSTDPSEPTAPEKRTVTVVDGKITAIDDVPTTEDTTMLDDAVEGTKITLTADDRSAEGKTFREWVVSPENSGSLADASSSTTTFTMGAESVTIEAQYDDSTTPTPTPDPTPTPGGDDSGSGGSSSGGGGGGGGAAVILGVGVAAAVTAGVIMTMPVEVQGRVELADHTAVPGAKISLLQNGSVVAQTTADDSGSFSLKAKRGDYELTVVYTDANGQFVQKTTSLKAPAKDLVITF